MNFTFENQGTSTFLVYEIEDESTLDTMSMGMLTNNKIPGLAASMFTQMDTTRYMKYNISAKISAKQFFSGSVNKKRLIGVFAGIVEGVLSAEEYMLDANTILLDLDYIFVDVSTFETSLICLPVMGMSISSPDLCMFFKQIMFATQFDQTENCDYIAKIINYLNSTPLFSMLDFKAVLDGIKNEETVISEKAAPEKAASEKVQTEGASGVKANVMQQKNNVQPAAGFRAAETGRTVQPVVPRPPEQVKSQMQIPVSQNAMPQQTNAVPRQTIAMPQQTNAAAPDEKQISMFYLLQHYNKENAAAYKAQKAARKESRNAAQNSMGNIPSDKPEKAKKKKAKKKNKQNGKQISPGFAVPGQSEQFAAIPAHADTQVSVQNSVAPPLEEQNSVTQAGSQIMAPLGTSGTIAPQVHTGMTEKFIRTSANFGETTVLNSGGVGETTVLDAVQPLQPYLVRVKNNERILLNKPVFRIGKEKSYVDYFIGDNTAISRSHASIITKDGAYFVMDTNSTNHTYVNEAMIQSNEEIPISSGTKIRFANEEFEFRVI